MGAAPAQKAPALTDDIRTMVEMTDLPVAGVEQARAAARRARTPRPAQDGMIRADRLFL